MLILLAFLHTSSIMLPFRDPQTISYSVNGGCIFDKEFIPLGDQFYPIFNSKRTYCLLCRCKPHEVTPKLNIIACDDLSKLCVTPTCSNIDYDSGKCCKTCVEDSPQEENLQMDYFVAADYKSSARDINQEYYALLNVGTTHVTTFVSLLRTDKSLCLSSIFSNANLVDDEIIVSLLWNDTIMVEEFAHKGQYNNFYVCWGDVNDAVFKNLGDNAAIRVRMVNNDVSLVGRILELHHLNRVSLCSLLVNANNDDYAFSAFEITENYTVKYLATTNEKLADYPEKWIISLYSNNSLVARDESLIDKESGTLHGGFIVDPSILAGLLIEDLDIRLISPSETIYSGSVFIKPSYQSFAGIISSEKDSVGSILLQVGRSTISFVVKAKFDQDQVVKAHFYIGRQGLENLLNSTCEDTCRLNCEIKCNHVPITLLFAQALTTQDIVISLVTKNLTNTGKLEILPLSIDLTTVTIVLQAKKRVKSIYSILLFVGVNQNCQLSILLFFPEIKNHPIKQIDLYLIDNMADLHLLTIEDEIVQTKLISNLKAGIFDKLNKGQLYLKLVDKVHKCTVVSRPFVLANSCGRGQILNNQDFTIPDIRDLINHKQCYDFRRGFIHNDGDIWHIKCSTCVCINGKQKCFKMNCPNLSCIQLKQPRYEGQCCPICRDTEPRGRCYYEGDKRLYPIGVAWHPFIFTEGYKRCIKCYCTSPYDYYCMTEECPKGYEPSDPTYLKKGCCSPVRAYMYDVDREGCWHDEVLYKENEVWVYEYKIFDVIESVECTCKSKNVTCANL